MIPPNKIKRAALWSSLEALSSLLLGIVSIVFLARLLSLQDYGQIATAQFISALIQLILGLGLNEAIIQKKNLSKKHIASALSGTIILGVIGFLICTLIAIFFYLYGSNKNLPAILLFEGITTFLTLASIVPTALLMRNLEMRSFAQRSIISKLFFFAVAIPLVLQDFGLWSIVFANIVQSVIATFLIFLGARKLLSPKVYLNFILFKQLSIFGVFVMFENLLWSVMSRLFGILISTFHGVHALGLFNMATRLTDTILSILNTVISRLALPIFSKIQDDQNKLNYSFKKATNIFNLISMPAFFGMAYTCDIWVVLVLGEQWKEVIPIIQIIAIMYGIMFSRMFVGTAIKAVGKSQQYLYLSFIAAVITLVGAFITKDMTLQDAVLVWAFPRLLITIPLGMYLLKKICNISIIDQIKPLYFPIILSITMLFFLHILDPLILNISENLTIIAISTIVSGIFIYIVAFIVLYKIKFIKI